MGCSDNVLTARAFAAKRHEVIDSGQEFLALGAANLAAGLFHGFPVSSSGSWTVVGDAMGSRSQLYSLVAMITVLLAVPRRSRAAWRSPPPARPPARFRRSGFLALSGIGVALGFSIWDLLRRIATPHDGVLGYIPGMAGMHDVDDYPAGRQVPALVVYRYDSPLFFANAEDFKSRALAAVDQAQGSVEWFLLNAEANIEVDHTAVDALDDLAPDPGRPGHRLCDGPGQEGTARPVDHRRLHGEGGRAADFHNLAHCCQRLSRLVPRPPSNGASGPPAP